MRNLKSPLCAGLCVLALGGQATAGEWTKFVSAGTRFSYNDNYFLDATDPQSVFSWSSNAGLSLTRRSDTDVFNLSGGIKYNRFYGDGADTLQPSLEQRLGVKYQVNNKRTTYSVGASYVRDDSSEINSENPDDLIVSRYRDNYSFSAEIRHQIDPRNTITWRNALTFFEFSGDGVTDPSQWSANSSLTWGYLLTKRTGVNLTASVSRSETEDDENLINYVYRLQGGFTTRLSDTLSIRGGLGVRLLDSSETDTTALGSPRTSTTSVGAIGNFGIDYKIKHFSFGLNTSYDVAPTSDGELRNRFTTSFSVGHPIDRFSSVNLTTAFVVSSLPSSSGNTDYRTSLTISPTYNRKLNQYAQLSLGYRYLIRDTSDETVQSNNWFMSVQGGF